jgi:uncharacterized membrane protein
MKHSKLFFITRGAIIAALYVALTFIANAFGLASGPVQVRLSEALTVLPYFTPAAIPGLFIGAILLVLATNYFGIIVPEMQGIGQRKKPVARLARRGSGLKPRS